MSFAIVAYETRHFDGANALWQEAFLNDQIWNKAEVAIPEKLRFQPDLFLVCEKEGRVIGSVMAGYDGHRGWISRIAVRKACSRMGIGRALLEAAEMRLRRMGCIKINLQVLTSNADVVRFYERLGYAFEPRISLSKRLL